MAFTGHSKYPHVSREDLLTRGWLLVRKCQRNGAITQNDIAVASFLLPRLSRASIGQPLSGELELIAYGTQHSASSHDAH